ncbi:MAG: LLM class flavin-dependent oxidoreductase, partial [Actinomycetota bacterium]|nr:LLM class flavin-dependent oxidoreductase [Actinomycetota bacterium]
SSSIIVERWMGAGFDRPLTRLREYVEVLREILAGKKVTYEGETTSVKGFRLQVDPGSEIPIYMAALGEKASRLAGEMADGVIFFLKTPHGVSQAMAWVAEGARAAGRDPHGLDCVIRIPIALNENEEIFKFMARRLVTTYAAVDVYNNSLSAQGYKDEAAGIARAWTAGDREQANEYVTDELLEDLFISGTTEECLGKLQSFRDAGVKTPVLSPVSVAGDPVERKVRVKATLEQLVPS